MDDEQRFRQLFAEAYPALRRYAHHRGLRGADADDLVSAVLTIAWQRLDAVPAAEPLPWLFATAHNVWRNGRRGDRRRKRLADRLPSAFVEAAPASLDATESDDAGTTAIRDALAALGPGDQEILRLIAWDGLTPAQAALVLGCSNAAARVRLHRARNRLAAELARRQSPYPPRQREESDDPAATH